RWSRPVAGARIAQCAPLQDYAAELDAGRARRRLPVAAGDAHVVHAELLEIGDRVVPADVAVPVRTGPAVVLRPLAEHRDELRHADAREEIRFELLNPRQRILEHLPQLLLVAGHVGRVEVVARRGARQALLRGAAVP